MGGYCSEQAILAEGLAISDSNLSVGLAAGAAAGFGLVGRGLLVAPGFQAAGVVAVGISVLIAAGASAVATANLARSSALARREYICEVLEDSGYLANPGAFGNDYEIALASGIRCGITGSPGGVIYYPPTEGEGIGSWEVTASTLRVVCQPIALDLDRDGLEWVSSDRAISADIKGDGVLVQTSWISADDGLLVFDHNGDGVAAKSEWSLTRYIDGATTDLEALRGFDSNADGVFNGADRHFASFKIGRDLNQNGKFDQGELFSLTSYGIAGFRTETGLTNVGTPDDPSFPVAGVRVYNYGQYVRTNGTLGRFADMAFEEEHTPTAIETFSDHAVAHQGAASTRIVRGSTAIAHTLAAAEDHFIGGAGADNIVGNAGANILAGGRGADALVGGGGDDIIVADRSDWLDGNLRGQTGYDTLIFDDDAGIKFNAYSYRFEHVVGGSGDDILYTLNSLEVIESVTLFGQDGNDILKGGAGSDVLVGGAGTDSFYGYSGDDIFVIDRFDDIALINVGGGSYESGDTIILDDRAGMTVQNMYSMNVRQVYGGVGNDIVYASRIDSDYWREGSDNTMSGGKGNDYLYGGSGSDTFMWSLGDGHDRFVDRDYGERQGDLVSLGRGVTPNEVTVHNVSGTVTLTISGVGGGSVKLIGFASEYGPDDLLAVGGQIYNLKSVITNAGSHYTNGMLLSENRPVTNTTGTGGGDYEGEPGTGGGGGGTGAGDEQIPPVLLDLDGDGFELIDPKSSGIWFDWDGDGLKEETGWAGADDGFLVIDLDGDGDITRAEEISFGIVYGKQDGFVSDLEGLRAYDSNGNGSLDGGDAAFGQFRVWRDADTDALVDEGELVGLEAMGLVAMSLTGYRTGESLNGKDNSIYATTDAVLADGSGIKVADVFLGFDQEAWDEGSSAMSPGTRTELAADGQVHIV